MNLISYYLNFYIREIPQKAKCDVCGEKRIKGDTMLTFVSQVKSMKPKIRLCKNCIYELQDLLNDMEMYEK